VAKQAAVRTQQLPAPVGVLLATLLAGAAAGAAGMAMAAACIAELRAAAGCVVACCAALFTELHGAVEHVGAVAHLHWLLDSN
jgi:hypothetical protein